jgi:hypothetical protein
MLCVIILIFCRNAECCYAGCHYAECHCSECRYAEYRGASLMVLPMTSFLDDSLIFAGQASRVGHCNQLLSGRPLLSHKY